MSSAQYRLVTRSDFDGLVCAVLLRHLDMIDDIVFVHPKDVQDGAVEVTGRDILTNLPYAPAAKLVFDHHHSESVRTGHASGTLATNYVLDPSAPSAARVVYRHFGGEAAFPAVSREVMEAVDRADSADYALADILDPQGWTLLNFLMDSRTGLGRFRDFRISNYQLMMQLIDEVYRQDSVAAILTNPDVVERVTLFRQQNHQFADQLRRVAAVHGDVVVLDLREEETVHAGNRFLVYALFPQCRVSAHVMWGKQRLNTVVAVGKSILDRTSAADIGSLMLRYGGGGHRNAGTCQVPHDDAARVIGEIVAGLNESVGVR